MLLPLVQSSRVRLKSLTLGVCRQVWAHQSHQQPLLIRSFHKDLPAQAPKLGKRLRHRFERATKVVGKPLTPTQRKYRNIGMSALGIGTAGYALAVVFNADYPFSMAAIGAFRTTTTFATG